MISKKFLKNSFLYTITGALPIASPIILLPFYSNNLSTANFGYLGLYIGITHLLQLFITFSFDQVITTYYFEYKDDKEKLMKYVSSAVSFLLLLGCSLSFVLSLIGPWIFELIYSDVNMNFYPNGLMCVITATCTSLFKVYTTYLIAQQKSERFFFSNILNFALVISISLLGLQLFPHSLLGPMLGRLIASAISFILAIYYFFNQHSFKVDFRFLRKSLAFNLPIFAGGIVAWLLSNGDRYIINYYMTPSQMGIFEFALRCSIGIEVVFGALFNTVVSPIFTIWSKNRTQFSGVEVNRYYNVLTSVCILVISLSIFFLPVIIPFIVKGKQYYNAFQYIPLLCLAFIFQVMWHMHSMPFSFEKKGKIMTKLLIINCIVKLSLGLILIKYLGLTGAVWAYFISKTLFALSVVYIGQKKYKLTFNKIKIIVLPVVYALIVISTVQFVPTEYQIVCFGLQIFVVLGVISLIYKKEILQLLQSFNIRFQKY